MLSQTGFRQDISFTATHSALASLNRTCPENAHTENHSASGRGDKTTNNPDGTEEKDREKFHNYTAAGIREDDSNVLRETEEEDEYPDDDESADDDASGD